MPLTDSHGQAIGSVMHTKPRTNPLFISPGHKVSVLSATQLVADCLRGYRLPEPTRQAHNLITAYKKIGVSDPTIASPVSVQETLSL